MKKPFSVDWYIDSFLGAVLRFTNEQVGAYTLLLNNQIHGHFTDQEAIKICGSLEMWNFLRQKFTQDENGLWYNLKMNKEILKKQAYLYSRSNNGKNKHKAAYAHAHGEAYAPAYEGVGSKDRDKDGEKEKGVIIKGPKVPEWLKSSWCEWEQHRKEKKAKLTPKSIEKQLKMLIEAGPERAIAAINYSIRNGWIGIFEEKKQNTGKPWGRQELTPEILKNQMEHLKETRGTDD
jgi:uncharacterized protein YdaU (DUF1376 family)